jgi:hypothetical protein
MKTDMREMEETAAPAVTAVEADEEAAVAADPAVEADEAAVPAAVAAETEGVAATEEGGEKTGAGVEATNVTEAAAAGAEAARATTEFFLISFSSHFNYQRKVIPCDSDQSILFPAVFFFQLPFFFGVYINLVLEYF